MFEERRKAKRISKPFSVLYKEADKPSLDWDETYVQNVSSRGMLITTKEFFKPGTILNIKIKFPFTPFQWSKIDSRVIESNRIGISSNIYFTRVEFINLKEDMARLINAYNEWFLTQMKGEKGR